MNDVIIVRLDERMLGEVLAIEAATFHRPWTEGMFMDEITRPESVCLAALDGGAFVGYIITRVIAGEKAELMRIAVSPRARRRGLGSALMLAAMDELSSRGVRTVHLEVRESNDAAIALYRAHGFKEEGRRKAYYEFPPEDALLMGICLDAP